MSNVLIGIVGVILFIAMALAGAVFFGPLMTGSVDEGRASGTSQVLSATAIAVTQRNRDLETRTPSGSSVVLAPDYLDKTPQNPVNGEAVYLLDANAGGTGPAAFVATKMPSDRVRMCEYLSRAGGGSVPVSTANTIPIQRMGCIRMGATVGPYVAGDYVGFARIS
jgi:hypothetical protein